MLHNNMPGKAFRRVPEPGPVLGLMSRMEEMAPCAPSACASHHLRLLAGSDSPQDEASWGNDG